MFKTFGGAKPLWHMFNSSHKEPVSSSRFPATEMRTKFLLTAARKAQTMPALAEILGFASTSPKLPPPWASPLGMHGAKGTAGLPFCFSTHTLLQEEHLYHVMGSAHLHTSMCSAFCFQLGSTHLWRKHTTKCSLNASPLSIKLEERHLNKHSPSNMLT